MGDIPDSAMLAAKLISDRALELVSDVVSTTLMRIHTLTMPFKSRAAALSELMGENAQECEIAYDTALWMLYAILDEIMQEGGFVDEEAKVTVRNCKCVLKLGNCYLQLSRSRQSLDPLRIGSAPYAARCAMVPQCNKYQFAAASLHTWPGARACPKLSVANCHCSCTPSGL